jgi:hypothetical protein
MKNSASNLNIDEADREFIQSPISVRNININKRTFGSPLPMSKKCRIDIECGCGRSSFDIPLAGKDIEKAYDMFAKRCLVCGQTIGVTFDFKHYDD